MPNLLLRLKAYIRHQLPEGSVAGRLFRGAFWSLLSNFGSKILTMVGAVFIARMLGAKGYGEFSVVQTTLGLFGAFAGIGLGMTCTKYIAEFRKSNPAKASAIFSLAFYLALLTTSFMIILCLFGSEWISTNLLKNNNLSSLIMIGSVLLFVSTFTGIFHACFDGFEAFKIKTNITLPIGVITVFISLITVYYWGVKGAILGLIIPAVFSFPLYIWFLNKELRKNQMSWLCQFNILNELKNILRLGIPTFISGILIVLVTWVLNIILIYQENGYEAAGIFNVANQWRLSLNTIILSLSSALLPVFSDLQKNKSELEFNETIAENMKLAIAISLPITAFWIAVAKPFALLYGPQFAGVSEVFVFLLLCFYLNAIGLPLGNCLVSKGKMRIYLYLNLLWGLLSISFALILCPHYSGKGLALAYLGAYAIHAILKLILMEFFVIKGVFKKYCLFYLIGIVILSAQTVVWFHCHYATAISLAVVILSTIPILILVKKFLKRKVVPSSQFSG